MTIVNECVEKLRHRKMYRVLKEFTGYSTYDYEFHPNFDIRAKNPPKLEKEIKKHWKKVQKQFIKKGIPVYNGETVAVSSLHNLRDGNVKLNVVESDYAHYVFGDKKGGSSGAYALSMSAATSCINKKGKPFIIFGVRDGTGNDDGKLAFAPAGNAEPAYFRENLIDSILMSLYSELQEELGIHADEVDRPIPLNIADNMRFNYAVGYRIKSKLLKRDVMERFDKIKKKEYSHLVFARAEPKYLAKFVLDRIETIEPHTGGLIDTMLSQRML
jgi:hypothetical protein